MIDLRHPWMVLALRVSWAAIEAALVHKRRSGRRWETGEMFGPSVQVVGAGVSAAGHIRQLFCA